MKHAWIGGLGVWETGLVGGVVHLGTGGWFKRKSIVKPIVGSLPRDIPVVQTIVETIVERIVEPRSTPLSILGLCQVVSMCKKWKSQKLGESSQTGSQKGSQNVSHHQNPIVKRVVTTKTR